MTPSIDTSITWSRPYNSALEAGLRALALLVEAYPNRYDLSRLLYFDYLIVHSGDVPGGPASLHPATPHRSGELLVRRGLVEQGLMLMASRGLIEQPFDASGITYQAAEPAAAFLDTLQEHYTRRMRERAAWVVATFASYTPESMDTFVRKHLDRWGAEFESESVVRELPE